MTSQYSIRNSIGYEIATIERKLTAADVGREIGAGLGAIVAAYTALNNWTVRKLAESVIEELQTGIYHKIEKNSNSLVSFRPQDPSAYLLRGMFSSRSGMKEKAIKDFTKAIELDGRTDRAYVERAVLYMREQDWSKALQDLSTAVQINPSVDFYWLIRGIALSHIGDLEQSLSNLNRAIELNPGDPENYHTRARVYLERGEIENTIADASRAIKLNPNEPEIYRLRSEAYQRQNKLDESQLDRNKARPLEALKSVEQEQKRRRNEQANLVVIESAKRQATVALILAILSWILLPFGPFLSLPAVFKGHQVLGELKSQNVSERRGLIITTLIIGYSNILVILPVYILFVMHFN